ncbi:hypothetical protein AWENTII_012083 [Aspergillus wentii]
MTEFETNACDQCHRTKQSCTKHLPQCQRCVKSSTPCTYSFGKFMGRPKKRLRRKQSQSQSQTEERRVENQNQNENEGQSESESIMPLPQHRSINSIPIGKLTNTLRLRSTPFQHTQQSGILRNSHEMPFVLKLSPVNALRHHSTAHTCMLREYIKNNRYKYILLSEYQNRKSRIPRRIMRTGHSPSCSRLRDEASTARMRVSDKYT